MIKRIWNKMTDGQGIESGLTVISSIFMACAGLVVAIAI